MIIENFTKEQVGITKSKYDFSNFFEIAYDSEADNFFYGINKTIYFKTPPNGISLEALFTYYTVHSGDTWPSISYKHYQTVKLWWMICRFNNINNCLVSPVEDSVIKILNLDMVETILKTRFS